MKTVYLICYCANIAACESISRIGSAKGNTLLRDSEEDKKEDEEEDKKEDKEEDDGGGDDNDESGGDYYARRGNNKGDDRSGSGGHRGGGSKRAAGEVIPLASKAHKQSPLFARELDLESVIEQTLSLPQEEQKSYLYSVCLSYMN